MLPVRAWPPVRGAPVPLSSGRLGEDLGKHVPAKLINEWVKQYVGILAQPGGVQRARNDPEKMDALVRITENLLPSSIQKPLIQALQDRHCPLLISPDGALEQVPFEALLVEGGDRPQFLIDCLPPTGVLYAPSLMIVDALERAPAVNRPRGLLTVGGPDFSGFRSIPRLHALADLADLESARKESNLVAKSFRSQSTPIRQLLGAQATKRQLRTAITECCPSCLHVATHAVDPSAAGTTALVLCPEPHSGDVSDNGLLEINGSTRCHCEDANWRS